MNDINIIIRLIIIKRQIGVNIYFNKILAQKFFIPLTFTLLQFSKLFALFVNNHA